MTPGTFAASSVALSGSAATASWSIPTGLLSQGLAGDTPASAWSVSVALLTPSVVALSGSASVATWTIPPGGLSFVLPPQPPYVEEFLVASANDLYATAVANDLFIIAALPPTDPLIGH
jgi:hypothetical protein